MLLKQLFLHKYLYVGANPVSYRDPSGKDFEDILLLRFGTNLEFTDSLASKKSVFRSG
jgi:hypothetical protein